MNDDTRLDCLDMDLVHGSQKMLEQAKELEQLKDWQTRAVMELRDFCHDTCWHHTKEREMGCDKSPKDCRVKKLLLEAEGGEG